MEAENFDQKPRAFLLRHSILCFPCPSSPRETNGRRHEGAFRRIRQRDPIISGVMFSSKAITSRTVISRSKALEMQLVEWA